MRADSVTISENKSARETLRPVFITVLAAKLLVAGILIANLSLLPHASPEPQIIARD